MAHCPRCGGAVSETAAVCGHCEAYLLDWDARRGALGPVSEDDSPTADAASAVPRPTRRPLLAALRRPTRTIGHHASLTVMRWLCAVGMTIHALLVLAQLVEPGLELIAWIVLWLPIDGFHRTTGR